MDSDLPEETLPAGSNTPPSDLLNTETVSPHQNTTRKNATVPCSTVNNDISETLFTSPTTSGEKAITINPPESTPPQISSSTTSTFTPGSMPSHHESGMHI